MIKKLVLLVCTPFIFFLSKAQPAWNWTDSKTWNGPVDIRMIASPILQAVYIDPTEAGNSRLKVLDTISYNTMIMYPKKLDINNRYQDGTPGTTLDIPNTALKCSPTDQACLLANLTSEINDPQDACPIEYDDPTKSSVTIAMSYADYDKDPTTFSSSMARLKIPNCSEVETAYLYWTGIYKPTNGLNFTLLPSNFNSLGSSSSTVFNPDFGSTAVKTIKFMVPGVAGYQSVTATTSTDYGASDDKVHMGYLCAADVTTLVKQGVGSGDYWAANIQSYPERKSYGSTSGWVLIVVYKSPLSPPRSIALWNGKGEINSTDGSSSTPDNATLNLSGFTAPATTNITSYIGYAALDGENIYTQLNGKAPEGLLFENGGSSVTINPNCDAGSTTKYPLYSSDGVPETLGSCGEPLVNNLTQVCDGISSSHISSYDDVTKTNGNRIVRLPSNQNTLGLDVHHIKLPDGSVKQGTNAASITVASGEQGGLTPFLAYIAIEQLQPKLILSKTADKGTTAPGGTISYKLKIENAGNQVSTNGDILYDTLDPVTTFKTLTSTKYVNGTASPGGIAAPAINGQELKFSIPAILPKDSVVINFTVDVLPETVASAKALYDNCKRTIENVGWIEYKKNNVGDKIKSKSNSSECNDGSEVIVIITGLKGDQTTLNTVDASSFRNEMAVKHVRRQIFLQHNVVAADTAEYIVYNQNGQRVFFDDPFPSTGSDVTYRAYRTISGPQCQDAVTITFTFCPPLSTPTAPSIPSVCDGATTTLTATGTPNGTAFYWYTKATGGTPNANGFTTPTIKAPSSTFYLIDSNATTGCKSPRVAVTVNTKPVVNPGAIGGATSICSGTQFTVSNTNAATVTDNTPITYKWLSSVDNVTYTVINGEEDPTYTGSALVNTYFRREATAGCKPDTTDPVLITILPGLDPGTIAADTTVCYNSPARLRSTALPSGGSGGFAYSWESSTNGTVWTPVAAAQDATYTTPALTDTTQYRRIVTSGTGTCSKATSDPVTITVLPDFGSGGSIQASKTPICSGESINLTSATPPSGGTGSYTYVWTQSDGTTNTTLTSTTTDAANITLTATAQTVYTFTRTATSGTCGSQSATVQVIVKPLVDFSVTLDPVADICASDPNPVVFTAKPTPSNLGSSGVFEWTVGTTLETATGNTLSKLPSTLTDGNKVKVALKPSADVCPSTTPATAELTLVVATKVVPTIAMDTPDPQCEGTAVLFTARPTGEGPTPTYSWTVNGNPAIGATNTPTYTYNAANNDVVAVTVTTSSNCKSTDPAEQVATATVTMVMKPLVTPTVVISVNTLNPCENEEVRFKVDTKTNEGTTPTFEWFVGGGSSQGPNGSETFVTNTLTGTQTISVRMTSDVECVNTAANPATSNLVSVTVSPRLAPKTGIFANPNGTICAGQSVTFSASQTTTDTANGGGAVRYEWFVGSSGVLATTPTFTSSTLANGDIVKVNYISSLRCLINNDAVATNQLTMKVNTPVVSITGTPTFCSDDNTGVLTAVDNGSGTDQATGALPTFSWTTQAGTFTGSTLNRSSLVDGETVTVTMSPGYVCNGTPTSAIQLITIYAKPVAGLTILAPEICPGEATTLTATGGTVSGSSNIIYNWFKSNPIAGNGSQLPVSEAGTYKVRITNGLPNCFSEASQTLIVQNVTVDAGPDLSMYRGESVVLQGTSNGSYTYSWSPSTALSDETVLRPTASPKENTYYTITATSNIGCKATDQVYVQVFIPVFVPNAFSPNNDGQNDVWVIDGLEKFPNSHVYIYNRWGSAVYTDKNGYQVPWDGRNHGTQLPTGTYYYVIDLKGSPDNTDRSVTGSLTIVK